MIKLLLGGVFRFILGILWIIVSIPGWVILTLPIFLASWSVKIICWSKGGHTYDPYRWLMEVDLLKIFCQVCGKTISDKDLPDYIKRRDQLIANIHTVSHHLQEVSEQNEVSVELSKVV